MEVILGVIEDLLDKYESGSAEEKHDAGEELKLNFDQFKSNLAQLSGNADAQQILERLEKSGVK